MISIEKALRHMAWSNQVVFREVSNLPEDIYEGHKNRERSMFQFIPVLK